MNKKNIDDDTNGYNSASGGKFLDIKQPFVNGSQYEKELERAFMRKRAVKRQISESYMQETHMGGRLENVQGFNSLKAMVDSPNIAFNYNRKFETPKIGLENISPTKQTNKIVPESIFDEGHEWTPILETGTIPWRSICHLEIIYESGRRAYGTGWMAGPDTVITAGHNVLSQEGDGWATGGITISPGRNSSILPFDETYAVAIDALSGWQDSFDSRFDLGVLKLADSKLGLRTGWFGYTVLSDQDMLTAPIVNNAGYPGRTKPFATQWFDASRIRSFTNSFIKYRLDTEAGQSGSPIFFTNFEGQRLVVATHVYGSQQSNLGLRINDNIFKTMDGWVKS